MCVLSAALFAAGGCRTPLQKLELEARKGDASSQARLGRSYLVGGATKINYQLAHSLLRQAAASGSDDGRYGFGVMQELGLDTLVPNRAKAERFYMGVLPSFQQRARTFDDANALFFLGEMCRFGRGLPRDPERARAIFEDCARRNHPEAAIALGTMLFRGEGGPSDEPRARTLLHQGAVNSYPEAQYQLGLLLEKHGRSDRARRWIRLAADNGYPPALTRVALRSKNSAESTRRLRLAAESGYAPACFALAGRGAEPAEQEILLLDAAVRNHTGAMAELARRRRNGANRPTARVMALLYFAATRQPENAELQRAVEAFDRETGLLIPIRSVWRARGMRAENLLLTVSEPPRCIAAYKSGENGGGTAEFQNLQMELAANPLPFYLNNDWYTIAEHDLPLRWASEIFRANRDTASAQPGFWICYAISAGLAGRGATQFYAARRLAQTADVLIGADRREVEELARLLQANALMLLHCENESYNHLFSGGRLRHPEAPAIINFINFWCRPLCKNKLKLAAGTGIKVSELGDFALPVQQPFYDLYLEKTVSDKPLLAEPAIQPLEHQKWNKKIRNGSAN